MSILVIRNLHVNIEGEEIPQRAQFDIPARRFMGPNGTGKSTLAYALMRRPSYQVTEGEVGIKENIPRAQTRRAFPAILLAL